MIVGPNFNAFPYSQTQSSANPLDSDAKRAKGETICIAVR